MPKTVKNEKRGGAGQLKSQLAGLSTWLRRNVLFRLFVLWFISFMVLLSFMATTVLEPSNVMEFYPANFRFPLALQSIIAAAVAAVIYWMPWLRGRFLGRMAATVLLSLFLGQFNDTQGSIAPTIRALVPGLGSDDPAYIVALLYLGIVIAIATFGGRLAERAVIRSRFKHRDIQFGILVLIGYVSLLPVFSVFEMLPAVLRESSVAAAPLPKPRDISEDSESATKPDIYYLVLDRYTSSDVLDKQFSFDNSRFTGFLRDNGFEVEDDAQANYPYTTFSISSTLNAEYTDRYVRPYKESALQSKTLYHSLIWNSSVVRALKDRGYQYHMIGNWYGTSYRAPLANVDHVKYNDIRIFGVDKAMRGLEVNVFNASVFNVFARSSGLPSWWPLKASNLEPRSLVRQQLDTLDSLSGQQPGGRFVFAHILVPHDPFVFLADGSESSNFGSDSVGMDIKQKYTNQIQFINTEISASISKIREKDPEAVIILQSDEGAYPNMMADTFRKPSIYSEGGEEGQGAGDMRQWSDDWLAMKYGVLRAVHIPKATQDDLSHMSSVNVFRIVLNRYAGYELPYLPDCRLGFADDKKIYQLTDLTKRMTGITSDTCRALETGQPDNLAR